MVETDAMSVTTTAVIDVVVAKGVTVVYCQNKLREVVGVL
jgi:hypothetical protein